MLPQKLTRCKLANGYVAPGDTVVFRWRKSRAGEVRTVIDIYRRTNGEVLITLDTYELVDAVSLLRLKGG